MVKYTYLERGVRIEGKRDQLGFLLSRPEVVLQLTAYVKSALDCSAIAVNVQPVETMVQVYLRHSCGDMPPDLQTALRDNFIAWCKDRQNLVLQSEPSAEQQKKNRGPSTGKGAPTAQARRPWRHGSGALFVSSSRR